MQSEYERNRGCTAKSDFLEVFLAALSSVSQENERHALFFCSVGCLNNDVATLKSKERR